MNTESKQAAEQLAGARAIEKSIAALPAHLRHCDFMQTSQDPSEVGAVKRPVGGSSPIQGAAGFAASCATPAVSGIRRDDSLGVARFWRLAGTAGQRPSPRHVRPGILAAPARRLLVWTWLRRRMIQGLLLALQLQE